MCCILSKFYIKPQQFVTFLFCLFRCILSKFYIKPQLEVLPGRPDISCILSKFYIKPQPANRYNGNLQSCILSKFYIKPQHRFWVPLQLYRCILSKFYIKPQHYWRSWTAFWVVSYRNSTSNHNNFVAASSTASLYLIEILHQTTTCKANSQQAILLYLIEILHQTTTPRVFPCLAFRLYLIEILHQTTTLRVFPCLAFRLYLIEILHQTTTKSTIDRNAAALYLIEILHQTTTHLFLLKLPLSCILSKFYIKPQHADPLLAYWDVVSYRNSTSNHNYRGKKRVVIALYLIEILHQTTTMQKQSELSYGCILSKFYIKPQHTANNNMNLCVVSYRNSTSNHNY